MKGINLPHRYATLSIFLLTTIFTANVSALTECDQALIDAAISCEGSDELEQCIRAEMDATACDVAVGNLDDVTVVKTKDADDL